MANVNMEGLPPEMQARIQQIIEGAKQKTIANSQPQTDTPPPGYELSMDGSQYVPAKHPNVPAPIARPPSLMDHVIALRQDMAELQASINAVAQVTDAVGQAVGQLYGLFQETTTPSNFSTTFQTQPLQTQQDLNNQDF